MSKLHYGVGFNSGGAYKAAIDGKITKSYATWRSMIRRCYCPKFHAKQPTYTGCPVADEWRDFQDFAEWFENHEYSNYGYHLDKDLLIPGNKIYAPDRCVFIPAQLNSLLLDRGNARGQYPQGVYFHKGNSKFMAQINITGKRKGLGYFDTQQEAYQVYKKAKEAYVKRMANHWRDDIADEVYHALMNWELNPK